MSDATVGKKISEYPVSLFLIVMIFGIIFSLISIVNHYLLRTYALDLGVYNHALYSFSHLREPRFTLGLEGNDISFWGTHFSPITIIYTPFYFLFGSYTLLIIQIVAILLGGVGIYQYSIGKLNSPRMSLLILICFFSTWGIYSALSFDFHNNVIGAMLIPWFIYFLKKKKVSVSILFFILIISCQENVALWMIFIMIGFITNEMFLKNYVNDFKSLYFHLSLLVLSITYFLIVILILMPNLNQVTPQFFRYSLQGNSFTEIIASIIKYPGDAIKHIFTSSLSTEITHGLKTEFNVMVLLSGGIFLFFKPHYLIMLIPVYAQKMLSNDPVLWGIDFHYSIEFVPIISLCLIDSLASLEFRRKVLYGVLIIVMISTCASNIKTMVIRNSPWYQKTNTVFWQKGHYSSGLDLKKVYSTIELIPGEVAVSASSPLIPHLCDREKIYQFPVVKDAEYIAIFKGSRGVYPIDAEKLKSDIESFRNDSRYSIVQENEDIILIKRKKT